MYHGVIQKGCYGALAGGTVALLLLLNKQRKLVRYGVGKPIKHLDKDKYLFALLRKMRPYFRKTPASVYEVFDDIVTKLDMIAGVLIEKNNNTEFVLNRDLIYTEVETMQAQAQSWVPQYNNPKIHNDYKKLSQEFRNATNRLLTATDQFSNQ